MVVWGTLKRHVHPSFIYFTGLCWCYHCSLSVNVHRIWGWTSSPLYSGPWKMMKCTHHSVHSTAVLVLLIIFQRLSQQRKKHSRPSASCRPMPKVGQSKTLLSVRSYLNILQKLQLFEGEKKVISTYQSPTLSWVGNNEINATEKSE